MRVLQNDISDDTPAVEAKASCTSATPPINSTNEIHCNFSKDRLSIDTVNIAAVKILNWYVACGR
jgi:hypothetical protein